MQMKMMLAAGLLISATVAAAMGATEKDWPVNGRTFSETHFSPLTQITAANVKDLGLAWEFDDFVVRGRTHRGVEASPVMSEGVLYFSGPWSVVYAVDATTGRLRWKYDPQVPGQWARNACCDVVNRGVALSQGRVYVASLDGYLIALDAKSGAEVWRADTFIDRVTMNYSSTGAPRVAGGNVVIGNGGAEMGARGYVSAYDLQSGKLSWRFYTVPGDPKKSGDESPDVTLARKTWSKDSRWDLGGGGTVWDSMVYDAPLGLIYIGVGNGMPHPVWSRSPGGGDNLYLSSIVALDVGTGRMRWYYQTTPGDSWDYTASQNMILADVQIEGNTRHVLMQAPKNGFFYVLDRETGRLLSAKPYTKVTWAKEVNLATGKPVMADQSNYSTKDKVIWPSQAGGHNWMPMSFSETDKLVFIPSLDAGMVFGMVPGKDVTFRAGANNEGDSIKGWAPGPSKSKAPILDSVLKAWDPATAKLSWQTPPQPFYGGGVMSTAAGLVFQGSADGLFNAYAAKSGEKLASLATGTGIMAAPISYEIDGVQYIAVLAGFGGAMSAIGYSEGSAAHDRENAERLLVFKLGGGAVPMPALRRHDPQPVPAPLTSDAAILARGADVFDRCGQCHAYRDGPNAYPNLWNLSPGTHAAFKAIVLDGALSYAGMPSFKDALSEDDVRAVQAFIIDDEIKLRREESRHGKH
jgi:quinohemoprotein ethanol dehydrogenase